MERYWRPTAEAGMALVERGMAAFVAFEQHEGILAGLGHRAAELEDSRLGMAHDMN